MPSSEKHTLIGEYSNRDATYSVDETEDELYSEPAGRGGLYLGVGAIVLFAAVLFYASGKIFPKQEHEIPVPSGPLLETTPHPHAIESFPRVTTPPPVAKPAPVIAAVSPTSPPTPPPTLPPPPPPKPPPPSSDFGSVMSCVGRGNQKLTFKTRMAHCTKNAVEGGIGELGKMWSVYSKPDRFAEELSYKTARPLYSVPMAKACTSMSQHAQCGPDEYMKTWTCPVCQKEAGFHLTEGTQRFINYEEFGTANATFILVARITGKIHNRVALRPKEPLKNGGKNCWNFCGETGGYCAWCGVGNACCGNNFATDPLECKGANHGKRFHTCVAPSRDRTPAPVVNQRKNCYENCGQASGYCNFCGAGNACCQNNVADTRECTGATGFTTADHPECSAAPSEESLGIPSPTENETGCVLIVRGSHNKQNGMSNVEFDHTPLPFAQCKGCSMHAGFMNVWKNVHPKVVLALSSLGCYPGAGDLSRVLITGQSFGAAVATIGQYFLQATGYTMEMQYNFGSPRVGNVAWAENFNHFFDREVPLFRVTHAHDVVSRIPPTRFLGYRHVSAEVFYPAEKADEYVVCLGGEDYECQNRYDIAECISYNMQVYDPDGSMSSTPGEAMDADHCHSGLAAGGAHDMCQCTITKWWKWYQTTDFIKHRWDSAPNNDAAPRLAPGAMLG